MNVKTHIRNQFSEQFVKTDSGKEKGLSKHAKHREGTVAAQQHRREEHLDKYRERL